MKGAMLRCSGCRPVTLHHRLRVNPKTCRLINVKAHAQHERAAVHAVTPSSTTTSQAAGNHSTPEDAPTADPLPDSKHQQFNWYKAWYPVAVLEDLDPAAPTHLRLLGMDLAVWYDRTAEQWRAFQDRCPHRLAPLSEGRIDEGTGNLFCNYHGWQFAGSGRCTSIPQLAPDQNISNSRACAVSYPTRQAEGLLWVWPDASASAAEQSAAEGSWPGLAPEITQLGDMAFDSGIFANHKWYCRDLPASWLAAKENAYNDSSHDTVLHHGFTAALERGKAVPLEAKLLDMTPVGYTVREGRGHFQDIIRFPCGARRDSPGHIGLAYVVPTDVGHCRQFHAFLSTASKAPPASSSNNSSSSSKVVLPKTSLVAAARQFLLSLKPTWMQHQLSHLLIDADLAMQSRVDVNRSIDNRVYMPAASDAGPAAFMRWLKEYGGGGPPVAKLHDPFLGQAPVVPRDRQQLFDRLHSHTLQCKACRTAYQQASAAQQAAAVVAVVAGSAALAAALLVAVGWPAGASAAAAAAGSSAAAGVGGGGWGSGIGVVVGLAVVSALAGWLQVVLSRVVQAFVFVDYDRHHVSKK